MVYHKITITFKKQFTSVEVRSKLFSVIQDKYSAGDIWAAYLNTGLSNIHETMVGTVCGHLSIYDFKKIITDGLAECEFEIEDISLAEDLTFTEFNNALGPLRSKKPITDIPSMGANTNRFKRNIDTACYDQLPQELNDEIDRIHRTKPDKFIGYPCIYVLPSGSLDAISILMKELYENNRLRSKYIYRNTTVDNYYSIGAPENEIITDEYLIADQSTDMAVMDGNKKYSINDISVLYQSRQIFICSSKSKDFWISTCNKFGVPCVYIDTTADIVNDTEIHDYIKSFLEKRNDPEIEITEELIDELTCMMNKNLTKRKKYNRLHLFNSLTHFFDMTYKVHKQFHEYMAIGKVSDDFGKGDAMRRLNELIGLKDAKNNIKSILNTFLYANAVSSVSVYSVLENRNMVFAGNPGTCKTTIARILSDVLYENNILKKPTIKEVGRQDLVGKYVGWTASIVKEAYEDAVGGILFIDEAYSLSQDRGGYGIEAINTIVQCMENYRHDVITIFAGYSEEMIHFLESNPGFKSRIGFYINFPNYTVDELGQIFEKMVKDKGLKVTSEAVKEVKKLFKTKMLSKDFGNGRFVRNILDKVIANHANRMISKYDNLFEAPKLEMLTIRKEDTLDLNIKEIISNASKAGF